MSQYIKIPRGIKVDTVNDDIFEKTIREIGKKYSGNFVTGRMSDYARGKIYLRRKYGISGSALKKLHKIRVSHYGYTDIGVDFSNYVSIHKYNTDTILKHIIYELEIDWSTNFSEITETFFKNNPDIKRTYVNSLMFQTIDWIERCELRTDALCRFNKYNTTWDEVRRIKAALETVDKNL